MKWASLIGPVVLFSVPCDLPAQTDRATVTGTISDPSGAVVPGVQVYQSLQLSIQKRPAHGLSVLASYNLSSCHGDVDDSFEDLFFAGPLQNLYDLEEGLQSPVFVQASVAYRHPVST